MKLVPYLGFDGNCAEAFKFYEKALEGKIVALFTHGETPAAEHVPPDWRDKVMHVRLHADDAELMGGDAPPGRYTAPTGFHVSLHLNETTKAERIYAELSEGGTVEMELQETFWAHRFAMFTDRFGTPWMINCEKPA